MEKAIKVREIDSKYVGDDCAQVMLPIYDSLSVFSENNLEFYGRKYNENKIDMSRYMNDSRKNQFPYNDIPYHYSKKGLFSKNILYVNQLFDFNKPYILITEGILIESLIINKNEKTYMIQTDLGLEEEDITVKKYVEKERIYDYMSELIDSNDGKKTYVVDSFGKHLKICYDKDERKNKTKNLIKVLESKNILYSYDGHSLYYSKSPYISEDNFMLPAYNNPIFVVKLDGNQTKIKYIKINGINEDVAQVISYDLPIVKYNSEQIDEIVEKCNKTLSEPTFQKKLKK